MADDVMQNDLSDGESAPAADDAPAAGPVRMGGDAVIEETPADVNSASLRRLVQVPGIGRALARRIIEGRPYSSLEDLRRIEGLGGKRWDAIAPHLNLSDPAAVDNEPVPPAEKGSPEPFAEEAHPVEEFPSAAKQRAESTAVAPDFPSKPSAEETPKAPPPGEKEKPASPKTENMQKAIVPYAAKQPAYASRSFVLWSLALGGLVLLLLSVILCLGIISSLNNGLHFARPADLTPIRQDLSGLADDLDTMHTDLTGVRTRLDQLEKLSGRLSALESGQADLQDQQDTLKQDLLSQIEETKQTVAQTEQKVADMQSTVGKVQSLVDAMQSQVEKFRSFLDGLGKLVGGIGLP